MNAMVGDAGALTSSGYNRNNPGYTQFFSFAAIPQPSQIFVFLDEHPDSINDGYFVDRANYSEWLDLPASYHNGAGSFWFSDGHFEAHRWLSGSTLRPPQPDGAPLPMSLSAQNVDVDFSWVINHMSVSRW